MMMNLGETSLGGVARLCRLAVTRDFSMVCMWLGWGGGISFDYFKNISTCSIICSIII